MKYSFVPVIIIDKQTFDGVYYKAFAKRTTH